MTSPGARGTPVAGTLAASATFGIGFVCRPLGGLFFGHFGDKIGHKRMLVWTVSIMGTATALIGLLPTYSSIGWCAPLLVVLRAAQGFAMGGEWGGAALMAVENAPKKFKALYSSGVQVGYSVGLILATGPSRCCGPRRAKRRSRAGAGISRSCSAPCSWVWRCGFAPVFRKARSSNRRRSSTRPSAGSPRSSRRCAGTRPPSSRSSACAWANW